MIDYQLLKLQQHLLIATKAFHLSSEAREKAKRIYDQSVKENEEAMALMQKKQGLLLAAISNKSKSDFDESQPLTY